MFTTGRLPNTTPATQKAKQAVAITMNCGFLVEYGPIDRCTQRTAEKERREEKISKKSNSFTSQDYLFSEQKTRIVCRNLI